MHGMIMPLLAGTITVLVYRRGRMMRLLRIPAGVRAAIAGVLLAALSPLHEKNALKTVAVKAPMVLSMSRLIVLAFAVVTLRQLWRAGVAGWPDATLAVTVVLAIPIVGALERVSPEQVTEVARALVGRLGAGEGRRIGSVYSPREPSKYDDHRQDG
jgi:hypothetical protein